MKAIGKKDAGLFLGVDIGSSSSKAVLIDGRKLVLARAVENIGVGTEGPELVVKRALDLAGADENHILHTVATGYGRNAYAGADRQITEISCHGKGVVHLMPQARTVIDIGGQDAKIIRLSEFGTVENFVMNEKCAAGTGRFLEVMARILNCSLDQLADLSARAAGDIVISNTCTVFAESEVISQLAGGATKEEAARGVHSAIARRTAGLARRIGVAQEVVMSGGVALNYEVVNMLSQELNCQVNTVDDPQTVGAFGAALYALENFDQQ